MDESGFVSRREFMASGGLLEFARTLLLRERPLTLPSLTADPTAWFRFFNRDGTDRLTQAELVRGLIKCYPAACAERLQEVVEVLLVAEEVEGRRLPLDRFVTLATGQLAKAVAALDVSSDASLHEVDPLLAPAIEPLVARGASAAHAAQHVVRLGSPDRAGGPTHGHQPWAHHSP